MAKFKKIRAVGDTHNRPAGTKQIEKLLSKNADKHPLNVGYGRLITTVDSLTDIKQFLDDGYHILWCQMCKIVKVESEGEPQNG